MKGDYTMRQRMSVSSPELPGKKAHRDKTPMVRVLPERRPWVDAVKLGQLVHLSVSTIRQYNRLPNCPVLRSGSLRRYDVDKYMEWLNNDGPKKGRAMLAALVREEAK